MDYITISMFYGIIKINKFKRVIEQNGTVNEFKSGFCF